MKIEKVSISRTIPTGPYMNDKIGMEASLEDGETPEAALTELNKRVTEWHKAEHPELYKEIKMGGVMFFDSEGRKTGAVVAGSPVIDYKQIEELEIAIDNAQTKDQLTSIKDACEKAGLISQYIKRLNELTNG